MRKHDRCRDALDVYYDPYDAVIDRDPHPVWRRLRDDAPLYVNERYGFYALSRHDDVLAASLDWQTYSSARGTVLEIIDTAPGAAEDIGEMMIFMDPPRHGDLRKLVSRAFTPRRVSALHARIRELCAESLGPLLEQPAFDYLDDFAARIPSMVISALMGVPLADQDQVREWIDTSMRHEDVGISPEKADAMVALRGYMAGIVEQRQAEPRDDMVSDLLAAEIQADDGTRRRLTDEEVMAFFSLLQFAGTETTARLLGWAAVLLARHPDQRALLVREPQRIPNAVEELLRYEAPSPIQARFVTREVELYGQTVPRVLEDRAADRQRRARRARVRRRRPLRRHRATSTGTSASGTACTSASAPTSPGSKRRSSSRRRCPASPSGRSTRTRVEFVRTSTVRGPARVRITL